jgi:hypothetical protein
MLVRTSHAQLVYEIAAAAGTCHNILISWTRVWCSCFHIYVFCGCVGRGEYMILCVFCVVRQIWVCVHQYLCHSYVGVFYWLCKCNIFQVCSNIVPSSLFL